MQKVLITGGAGFMGSNFAKHFLDKGHQVTIFDNLSRKGCLENLAWLREHPAAENLEVVVGDVRMPPADFADHVESSDALFHLAGQVAVTTSVVDPQRDFEINALGTFNMLEAVRRSQGKRPMFFFASTNKVYGGMEEVEVVEGPDRYSYRDFPNGINAHFPLDFHSPYGCSKGAADQYVRDYARLYDLRTVVFRQSCIYGYRQFGIEDQGWVAWFIIAAVLGRPITIFGNGKQVRDVLFIEDLIRAYEAAWAAGDRVSGKTYNVGGGPGNTISLLDLIQFLRHKVDPDLNPAFSTWRPGDQPVYISDITECARDFGWQPEVDWCTGVEKLLDWVVRNKRMLQSMF